MSKKDSGCGGCAVPIVGFLLILPFFAVLTTLIVKDIQFGRKCEGHLKRAADSNTIELATKEMKVAVKYLEENGMTSGYTSIIYETPDEDVGFWYSNLKSSLEELEKVNEKAAQLERSNLLMKLRETLLDDTKESGTAVTVPPGISRFPSNTMWAAFVVLSIIFAGIGALMVLGYFALGSKKK